MPRGKPSSFVFNLFSRVDLNFLKTMCEEARSEWAPPPFFNMDYSNFSYKVGSIPSKAILPREYETDNF